jgi:hypothetical protein
MLLVEGECAMAAVGLLYPFLETASAHIRYVLSMSISHVSQQYRASGPSQGKSRTSPKVNRFLFVKGGVMIVSWIVW